MQKLFTLPSPKVSEMDLIGFPVARPFIKRDYINIIKSNFKNDFNHLLWLSKLLQQNLEFWAEVIERWESDATIFQALRKRWEIEISIWASPPDWLPSRQPPPSPWNSASSCKSVQTFNETEYTRIHIFACNQVQITCMSIKEKGNHNLFINIVVIRYTNFLWLW